MRIDGEVTYYCVKHVHPSSKNRNQWDGSGDLDQFKKSKELYDMCGILRAAGDLWQTYGIHGSTDKKAVVAIVMRMAEEYPDYKWGVFEITLSKKTTKICSFEYH